MIAGVVAIVEGSYQDDGGNNGRHRVYAVVNSVFLESSRVVPQNVDPNQHGTHCVAQNNLSL